MSRGKDRAIVAVVVLVVFMFCCLATIVSKIPEPPKEYKNFRWDKYDNAYEGIQCIEGVQYNLKVTQGATDTWVVSYNETRTKCQEIKD